MSLLQSKSMRNLLSILILLFASNVTAQQVQIGLLKYRGGGDWYANPTSLPNLIEFANQNLFTSIDPNDVTVEEIGRASCREGVGIGVVEIAGEREQKVRTA